MGSGRPAPGPAGPAAATAAIEADPQVLAAKRLLQEAIRKYGDLRAAMVEPLTTTAIRFGLRSIVLGHPNSMIQYKIQLKSSNCICVLKCDEHGFSLIPTEIVQFAKVLTISKQNCIPNFALHVFRQ